MSDEITVPVYLTKEQAWDLAQWLKRTSWTDYRSNARNDDEATRMIDAADQVRTALAEAGFAPR